MLKESYPYYLAGRAEAPNRDLVDYDKYSGDMINAHVMVNYSLSPRWELGGGYQFVDLYLEVEKTDFIQIYDIDFAGPMLYAKFHF